MLGLLVALTGFMALTLVSRRVEGSWIAPATFWPISWGLYAAAAIPYMAEPGDFVPALLWVLLSCTIFLVGGLLSHGIVLSTVRCGRSPRARFPFLSTIVFGLSIAAGAEVVIAIRTLGFSPMDLFSLEGLARMAARSRVLFTFGQTETGGIQRVLVVLAYTGTLFGGLQFAIASRWTQRILGLFPLVAIVLVGAISGSRMGVLFGGSFWVATFLAGRLLDTLDRPAAGTRLFFVIGGLSFGLLAGLSTAIQFVRYYVGNQKTADLIVADPFGFLAAFAVWFRQSGGAEDGLAAGFYSFERIGRMLGVDRPAFPAIDVGFTSSNVYTVFRALIQDFGAVGSLIVVLALGFTGSLAYRAVLRGRSTWIAPLALVYAFMFSGLALSIFAYTGPTIGAMAFLCYLLLAGDPPSTIRQLVSSMGPNPAGGMAHG